MPKVSIIIPVYNIEDYLKKCLESVINQTYRDLEIICVNDGSTDKSLEILKEYSKKDNRIKIINKQNGGLSSARNVGLNNATGEYIYFVDSDDWIELNTIEVLVQKMLNTNADCIVHSANNVANDTESEKIAQECNAWFDEFNKAEGKYDIPVNISKNICSVTWNKLYKMKIIEQFDCKFVEGLINEDELFLWTYMLHCKNYYYINNKFYNYLRRSDSIMGLKNKSSKILDIFEIFNKIYQTVDKYKNICEYKDTLTQNYIENISCIFPQIPEKYRNEALKRIKKYYKNINRDKRIIKLYRKCKYRKLKQFIKNILIVKKIMNFYNNPKRKIANTKIIQNKIVFNNMTGNGYGCNPKYIAQEIIRQKLPYKLVWLVNNVDKVKNQFPKEIELVEYNVKNAIREFASAKIWISNQRMPQLYENGLYKKKNQYYIQTWHGSFGIKKCEKSLSETKKYWCKYAEIDSQYIDCIISNSDYETKMFYNDFWYDHEVFMFGHARNDIFFSQMDDIIKIKQKVEKNLNISKEKKIVLYAPTYRDDDYSNEGNYSHYCLKIESLFNALREKFGGDWILLIRLHPNIANKYYSIYQHKDNIVNATFYPDLQELMLASDVMISDYSSCMFDFMLMKKPIFVYATDIKKYNNTTGFYYSLTETPFPIATNIEELENNIKNFNVLNYNRNVTEFLSNKGCVEKGNASEKIVELIKNNRDNFINGMKNDPCPHKIELKPGQYFADVLNLIRKLHI